MNRPAENHALESKGAIWDRPVQGRNLSGETFGDQFTPGVPTLLVFLRHFG